MKIEKSIQKSKRKWKEKKLFFLKWKNRNFLCLCAVRGIVAGGNNLSMILFDKKTQKITIQFDSIEKKLKRKPFVLYSKKSFNFPSVKKKINQCIQNPESADFVVAGIYVLRRARIFGKTCRNFRFSHKFSIFFSEKKVSKIIIYFLCISEKPK